MTTRPCGDCSACCTAIPVDAFRKPSHATCPQWASRGGLPAQGCCAAYAKRPSECRQYACEWLRGTYGGEDDRPDMSGAIEDAVSTGEVVRAYEGAGVFSRVMKP